MKEIFNFIPTKKSKNFSVNISLNKNFSKIEKEFFELLLFNFDLSSPYLSFDFEDLIKILNLKSDVNLHKFLLKLIEKKISYSISKDNQIIYNGIFSLISSYFQKKEKIYILTSQELKLFLTDENIFSNFNFKKFIFMEKNLSLILYDRLNTILPNTTLSITIAELKELFELEDLYERYYDFDKYILKKIVQNINKYTDLDVKYEKAPKSSSLINFSFKNTHSENIFEKSKSIMEIIKFKVTNYENINNLVINYLEKRGYNYVHSNVTHVNNLKNTTNFDTLLKKALLYDHHSSQLKNAKIEDQFILFFEKYSVYKNSILLQIDLYKYVNSILYVTPTFEELYSFGVINEIKNLENGSLFSYENNDFKILVEFLKGKNSSIQIFIKESLI